MSVSTLYRINFELLCANTARREDNYDQWWKALQNIYAETDAFIKDKTEKEEHEQNYKSCEMAYTEFINYTTRYATTKNRGIEIKYQPPRKCHDEFFKWERKLRSVLLARKLLIRLGEDPLSRFQKGGG